MIEAVEISKTYGNNTILDKFSIKVDKGDFISVTGESGKGKTTLLNVLGLLEPQCSGDLFVDGICNPNKKQRMLIQRNLFGYMFQSYALIENETVEKNLRVAVEYRHGIDKKEEIEKALEYVGLNGFKDRKVYELSGGEQQRVALARVFVKKCDCIFADEPTGNLDNKNRDIVFNLLKDLNHKGQTIIYVTHDTVLATEANNQIIL